MVRTKDGLIEFQGKEKHTQKHHIIKYLKTAYKDWTGKKWPKRTQIWQKMNKGS